MSEEKITNVVASLSTAPINTPTQLQSARQAPARVFKLRTCQPSFCGRANHPLTHNANDLLADVQQVDVSFVIQRGSSNALTPMQLAKAYTSAVKDGNETRSAAYFTSLTKEKAVTGPTKATPATEASVTVETDSVTEVAGAAVEDEKGPGMIVMAAIAVAGLCFIMILAYLLKKQCSSSNDVAKISLSQRMLPRRKRRRFWLRAMMMAFMPLTTVMQSLMTVILAVSIRRHLNE